MHQRSKSGQVEFTIRSIQNSSFRSQKEKLSKQKRLRQIQTHLLILRYVILSTYLIHSLHMIKTVYHQTSFELLMRTDISCFISGKNQKLCKIQSFHLNT